MKIMTTDQLYCHVAKAVCAVDGVKLKTLNSRRRTDAIARARFMVWFIMREHFGPVSFQTIGDHAGKDHGTIIAGVQRVDGRLEFEESTRKLYLAVCRELAIVPRELKPLQGKPAEPIHLRVKVSPLPMSAEPVRRSTVWPKAKPTATKPGKWRTRKRPNVSAVEPEPYRVSPALNFS